MKALGRSLGLELGELLGHVVRAICKVTGGGEIERMWREEG